MPPAPTVSIVDCELCNRLPQKVYADMKRGQSEPPEVAQLVTVLREDSQTREYAFKLTALKICPFCGTYYQYRYDRDEGEYFMDSTNEDVHIERCSLTWVRAELLKKTPLRRKTFWTPWNAAIPT